MKSIFLSSRIKFSIIFAFFAATAAAQQRSGAGSAGAVPFTDVNIGWWRGAWDEELADYIAEGIENNADIELLEIRIRQARKLEDAARASGFPLIAAGAGYSHFINPSELGTLTVTPHSGLIAPFSVTLPNPVKNVGIFSVPLAASWEVDIFGKNRDKIKTARKNVEVLRHELHGIYVSLAASIAVMYLNLVKIDAALEAGEEAIALYDRLVRDIEQRAAQGASAIIELNRVKQERNAAIINCNTLRLTRATISSVFLQTIGREETGVPAEVTSYSKLASAPAIPDIPDSSVFSRPDVLAAGAKLESANITAKIARKEYLPVFGISGALLFNAPVAASESGLLSFSGSGLITSFSAGLGMTLFDGGQKRAAENITKIESEAAAREYAKSIRNAARELGDSLLRLRTAESNYERAAESMKLEKVIYSEYQKQRAAGLISSDILLRARIAFLISETACADADIDSRIAIVEVYKNTAGNIPSQ
ncbi:MAG: efflux transporter outer membrane subunit [Treponemataceae bacterium]|nr:MAG: efflux transporter outer membrane subunit [Treponemataceae bacterium]